MNSSPLQQRFPLSPKKFKRKFIPSLFNFIILAPIVLIWFVFAGVARAQSFSADTAIFLLVIAGFAILIGIILNAWYIKEYIRRYYYSADNDFITIKKGVFAPTEIHVQFQKIQDVYVEQDLLDRLMGLYDVHIASATATSGIEAHIDGVDKEAAEGLKAMFLGKISSNRSDSPPTNRSMTDTASTTPNAPLDQNISSQTYPITSRWLILSYISSIIVGTTVFFVGFAFWSFLYSQGIDKAAGVSNSVAIRVILISAILLTIFDIVTTFIWRRNFKFELASDFIYCYKRVISTKEKRMPYSTVQDVIVSQSIIQRIVGLASVNVKNAATETFHTRNGEQRVINEGGITIPGQYANNARKLATAIKNIALSKNPSRTGL